ncbi:NFACT family protein [Peptococcaceae bacterium]|nr:NFACT family protein [Peptococcaceae bacterium]
MPYDGLVMCAVCHELSKKLIGGRIEKIYQPLKEEILIFISNSKERYHLLASSSASFARIHLTKNLKSNPTTPPTFCMVLRKHLEGGRIQSITQKGLDRILHIHIDTKDDIGNPTTKTLIIEIMGKHSNIILVQKAQGEYQIIDAIKRYSHCLSRHREVLPGKKYIPPPPHNKANILNLSEESFINLVTSSDENLSLSDILQKNLEGFSPLMCREIIYRCNLPVDILLNYCGEYELRLVWQQLSQICTDLKQHKFSPVLVLDKDSNVIDFAAFKLIQFENHKIVSSSMSSVLEKFYEQKYCQSQIQSKMNSLLTIVKQNISKLKNKISKHKKSLQSANQKDKWRTYGELLTANMHLLKKGMDKIELENFYSENLDKVTIELNPELSPAENAQAYFKKYNKAKKTIENVTQHLKTAEQELGYLENVEHYIKMAKSLEELLEIELELEEQGYIKKSQKKKKRNDKKDISSNILKYKIDDVIIMVGKNNRQNEYLTHRLAKPHDIWLHTKEIPGSHVIIKTEGKEIDDVIIKKAAQLAAYYSKARNSSKVPVDYTYIKNVKKSKGAKPGFVIYDNYKTVIVKPEEFSTTSDSTSK